MYAVGVGKAVEEELREIASDPVEKHFYYSADFTAISTIAENLKLNVCPGTVGTHDANMTSTFITGLEICYTNQPQH